MLWTRLAPEPLTADGGLGGAGNLEVGWEVASTSACTGWSGVATPLRGRTWRTRCTSTCAAWSPARDWYRFTAGDWASPLARTRTAPAPTTASTR